MITATIDIDGSKPSEIFATVISVDAMDSVMENWYTYAGRIITRHVKRQLGTANIYIQHPKYAAKKAMNPYVPRTENSTASAPLILTGSLYQSIHVAVDDSGANLLFLTPTSGVNWKAAEFQRKDEDGVPKVGIRGNMSRRERDLSDTQSHIAFLGRRSYLNKYATKWEEQTHFFEKGIAEAVPELEQLLGRMIEDYYEQLLYPKGYQAIQSRLDAELSVFISGNGDGLTNPFVDEY